MPWRQTRPPGRAAMEASLAQDFPPRFPPRLRAPVPGRVPVGFRAFKPPQSWGWGLQPHFQCRRVPWHQGKAKRGGAGRPPRGRVASGLGSGRCLCKVLSKQPPGAGRPCQPPPGLHQESFIRASSPHAAEATPCPHPRPHTCPAVPARWPRCPRGEARAAAPRPQDPEVNMEITNCLFLPAVAVSHRVP